MLYKGLAPGLCLSGGHIQTRSHNYCSGADQPFLCHYLLSYISIFYATQPSKSTILLVKYHASSVSHDKIGGEVAKSQALTARLQPLLFVNYKTKLYTASCRDYEHLNLIPFYSINQNNPRRSLKCQMIYTTIKCSCSNKNAIVCDERP